MANILLAVLASTILYVFSVVIYRLTLHPLAKYPGPFLAKITTWCDTYHSYIKDRHYNQLECHEKYGPILRYGPNQIIFNTTDGLRDIYTGSKNIDIQKAKNYVFLHERGVVSTHSAIDKDVHAVKRKVLAHGFSEQALRGLEYFMIENINKWLVVLLEGSADETKGWSTPKNMAVYANYLTLDVLGDLCFGKSFNLIGSSEMRGIPKLMITRAAMLLTVGSTPLMSLYKFYTEQTPFAKYLMPEIERHLKQFKSFTVPALKERLQHKADVQKNGGKERTDFIYYLSEAKDPETGKGYSQPELLAEIRLLIVAGSDTTSTTVAAAFFYLTQHPEKANRLVKELKDTFGSVDEIVSGPKLNSCHYLRAVIDESLRLSPPVPSSLRREVTGQGMIISGEHVPAGTEVGTSTYAIHRSPSYYPDPHAFKPERWLREYTDSEEVARAKSAFCPFSLGTRGCLGKPMAYNELGLALGRVFWTCDVRRKAGSELGRDKFGAFGLRDTFVAQRDGPIVEFRRRSDA